MHCPINGVKQHVEKSIHERDLHPDDIAGASLVDENEDIRLYDNGLMVRLTRQDPVFPSTLDMPFADFPEPPYTIPKPGK
jgi:hypothetical protein